LTCSNWFFFNNGVCSAVSDLCKEYDSATGACTSCFQGFTLNQGAC